MFCKGENIVILRNLKFWANIDNFSIGCEFFNMQERFRMHKSQIVFLFCFYFLPFRHLYLFIILVAISYYGFINFLLLLKTHKTLFLLIMICNITTISCYLRLLPNVQVFRCDKNLLTQRIGPTNFLILRQYWKQCRVR